jgi:transcriptional regulator with XRE-family HTH domain
VRNSYNRFVNPETGFSNEGGDGLLTAGEKIARARKYHAPALTQADLAARLGVDRATVARWETQEAVPERSLRRVAEVLDLPVGWFLDGQNSEPPNVRATRNPAQMGAAGLSLQRGDEVMLAVWRGVMASDGQCEFWTSESPEFRSIPNFLAGNDPERHVLCIASGLSMSPRLDHAERAVVRLDPDPPIGSLVIARRPDGANFIKALRRGSTRLELHSINPEFAPILELQDWALKGYVVAILHTYTGQGANIEWDDGRPLRA